MTTNDNKKKLLSKEIQAPNVIDPSILSVPSRHLVCGKSNSGKTTAILDFIMHDDSPFKYPRGKTLFIISLASAGQPKIQNAVDMMSAKKNKSKKAWDSLIAYACKKLDDEVEGIVNQFVDENFEDKINSLIIFDDQYSRKLDSDLVTKLYIKGRHKFASVMFLTQVSFQAKFMKDIARQSEYIWVFRNTLEDVQEIFKRSVAKDEVPCYVSVYKQMMKEHPYGYMVVVPYQFENKMRYLDFFNPVKDPCGEVEEE